MRSQKSLHETQATRPSRMSSPGSRNPAEQPMPHTGKHAPRAEARDSGGPMDVGRRFVPLVAALLLSWHPTAATAETLPEGVESRGDLKKMSIEELFNLEVTTVSTKPEALSATPAAVKVVTGDDIR